MHRNTGGGDVPPTPRLGGGALESTDTRVSANAFTININSINGNTTINEDFSSKRLNLIMTNQCQNFLHS